MRLAFVIPWYGADISGGAEAECYGLVHALRQSHPELKIEVVTTALKEFAGDWNHNFHREGSQIEDEILVHRFCAEPVNRRLYSKIQPKLARLFVGDLWKNGKRRSPLPWLFERFYIHNMVQSHSMTRFLRANRDHFDFFVFIPYMFGTTWSGSRAVGGEKSVIIPCLHNERYAYMSIYQKMAQSARALLVHVPAEQRLAMRLYNLPKSKVPILGEMVDCSVAFGDSQRFRDKYNIRKPYLLYAGRIVDGKNVPLMVRHYLEFRGNSNHGNDVDLVLIGKGDLSFPSAQFPGVHAVGFVPVADKFDAMRGALAFCQPSTNESFSIVQMESWLQETPVIVNRDCEVTVEHCDGSGGGWIFDGGHSFREIVDGLILNPENRSDRGLLGRKYVLKNYTAAAVTSRFVAIISDLNASLA